MNPRAFWLGTWSLPSGNEARKQLSNQLVKARMEAADAKVGEGTRHWGKIVLRRFGQGCDARVPEEEQGRWRQPRRYGARLAAAAKEPLRNAAQALAAGV
ncbi:hypothetical protein D9M73_89000 [compost metagenome]